MDQQLTIDWRLFQGVNPPGYKHTAPVEPMAVNDSIRAEKGNIKFLTELNARDSSWLNQYSEMLKSCFFIQCLNFFHD